MFNRLLSKNIALEYESMYCHRSILFYIWNYLLVNLKNNISIHIQQRRNTVFLLFVLFLISETQMWELLLNTIFNSWEKLCNLCSKNFPLIKGEEKCLTGMILQNCTSGYKVNPVNGNLCRMIYLHAHHILQEWGLYGLNSAFKYIWTAQF